MTTQPTGAAELPEALRLADALDLYATGDEHQRDIENAAAELRSLHALSLELADQLSGAKDHIAAQISALSAARAGVPAGYVLVPLTPTTGMLAALSGEWHPSRHRPDRYAAMLAASPAQPSHLTAHAQDDLQTLHDLLYTAQRYSGEARDKAINDARLVLYRLREAQPPVPARDGNHYPQPDLSENSELWTAIGNHRRAISIGDISAAAKAVDDVVKTMLRAYVDADRAARAAPQPADEGISRKQWIERAVRVYRVAGDTEDQALECAKALCREQNWDPLQNDLADPYDAAMSDIEERGPAPQPATADAVDAERWRLVENAPGAVTLRLHNLRPDQRAQYIDAALAAQRATHQGDQHG